MAAVKKPGQAGHQRGIGAGVVDGAGHHQAVRRLQLGRQLVYDVIKDAPAGLGASAAGNAPPDIPRAHLHRFHLHAFLPEDLLHRHSGIAAHTGAAVQDQNLHCRASYLLKCVQPHYICFGWNLQQPRRGKILHKKER